MTAVEAGGPRRGNGAFYLLITGAFAFLTIPRMAQSGMFLDGLTYASISRNLAQGIGSFWVPSYTSTLYPQFYEHPPLGFALQALGFRFFGDYLFVERAYSFLAGALIGFLIIEIWRSTVGESKYEWLPIVFWLLPSTVTWSIVNNLLETTQTLFTTLAVLCFVRSLHSGRIALVWASLSGLCVVGAVLTKGPTGLFPLAAPLIAMVVTRAPVGNILRSGVTLLTTAAATAAVVFWPEGARAAFSTYWDRQVVASMSGARGGGRWSSLARHLSGGVIIRMGSLLALAWLYRVVRNTGVSQENGVRNSWGWFFLLLALAGSVPVVLSARVMGHYLVPSLPLYALGCATLCLTLIKPALDRWRSGRILTRVVGTVGAVLLIAAVAIPVSGGTLERRDSDWILEYRHLADSIPRGATLSTCEAVRTEWGLHAYMQRFFQVSLDPEPGNRHRYFLQRTDRQCEAPPACRISTAGRRLVLLDCEPGRD